MKLEIIQDFGITNTSIRNKIIQYIILHYSAGVTSKAGSALNLTAGYKRGALEASSDFVVDDTTVVQYNQDIRTRFTWGVNGASKNSKMSTTEGGKYFGKVYNYNSIQIEICSNKKDKSSLYAEDTDWYFTDSEIELTTQLVKYLMQEYDIPFENVIMHHHVTGKICPSPWVVNEFALKGWRAFKNRLIAMPIPQVTFKSNVNYNGGGTNTSTSKPKIDYGTNKNNAGSYPFPPFLIEVKIPDLCYRDKPDGNKKGMLNKQAYRIEEITNDWGYIKNKGWVYLANADYLKIFGNNNKIKVKIIASLLNIREKPTTDSQIKGVLHQNYQCIIDQKIGNWGHLETNQGWICLDYTKQI